MTIEEVLMWVDSIYAASERSKNIEFFDLYKNSHKILQKKDKVVGDKKFYTTKLPLNFYKLVVKFIVNFVLSQPVTVSHADKNFNEFIREFHDLNSIHTHNLNVLEHACVFGKAFEHIFFDEEGKLRIRLIDGLAAIPFWDDYMELEAFIEDFRVKELDGFERRYIRAYNEEKTIEIVMNRDAIEEATEEENLFGLPIIAYKNNEFHHDVESDLTIIKDIVEELERTISDVGDIVHYHADPILVAFGQKLPDIGGTGKILNFEKGADVKYLTWDQNIDAVNWYVSKLKDLVYELSLTPKFVFDQQAVSSLSGVALKLMYSGAIIKAQEKQSMLKEGFLKRYAYLAEVYKAKTGRSVDLSQLDIDFAVTIPTNETELINNILTLYSANLISRETALQKIPYVENVKEEIQRIDSEQEDVYAEQVDKELEINEEG